ncbi:MULTISPECIES: hypothetical protein [unclassified Bradyrhizobium]|uniref:hypothetical protein n=1 Tax=unclassified Bradyrhizobium TaxID=2631580 RepID=UPI00247A8C86|nr:MULTISPECIES: hypothetical protein [unclassified Bradyrhizobium]WGS22790.1 hypothetical protein MTX22_14680 [Bradyrhizobium sp. ISRA463]WGS29782.1 hypothetical protein MTX19_12440 [Bradyrhizobium sp. ISRA464]
MALFGWESRKRVATYTRGADQKRLANEAATRLAAALTANKIVPPTSAVRSEQDNIAKKRNRIKG